MQSGSAVEAWLAELLFLLLHVKFYFNFMNFFKLYFFDLFFFQQEKLPVGVQDSLLSSLTSILWQGSNRL